MPTLHIGPEDILVTIGAHFADALSSAAVEREVSGLESAIKARFPPVVRVGRLFIETQAWTAHRAGSEAGGAGGTP